MDDSPPLRGLPVVVGGHPLKTASTDGSLTTFLICARNASGFSSGSIRTSSVTLASDGITLLPIAALNDVRRDGRPQHRGVSRLVLAKPCICRGDGRGVARQDIAVTARLLGRRNLCQPREVGGRRVVEIDRRLPVGDGGHRLRQVSDGVGHERHRSVTGRASRDQVDAVGDLLHRLHRGEPHRAALAGDASAFGVAGTRRRWRRSAG